MTKFVVVEVQALGSLPIANQPANGDLGWLKRLLDRVVDYFAEISGGREQMDWRHPPGPGPLFSNHVVTLDLSDMADVSKLTSAELVTRTLASLTASDAGLQPDDHLLVLKNFEPPQWAGSTMSDPTVSVGSLNANVVCHEIGHLLQRLHSGTSQHACTIAENVIDQYLDPTCVMGDQGNHRHVDGQILSTLPATDDEKYRSLVPPAMNPAMANLCGWFENPSPFALRDISGNLGAVFALAPWRGAPPPNYEGAPVALVADGIAPDGHRIYVTWRTQEKWDAGFPRADTIAVYEGVPSGPSLLLAEFEPVIGNGWLVDRCGLLITPQRLTGRERIELRVEHTMWSPDDVLQGATFRPASRIAALARQGLMEVFLVSADPEDRRVMEKQFTADMWQPGWITLDGAVASGPRAGLAVTSREPDNLTLFVIGESDGANGAQIRVRERNGLEWSPWDTIAVGGLDDSSQLAAVAVDPDRIDLFAVDEGGRVLHNRLDRGAPSSWTALPGWAAGGLQELYFGSISAQLDDDGFTIVHGIPVAAANNGVRAALPETTAWAYSMRRLLDGAWLEHSIDGDPSRRILADQGIAVARLRDFTQEVVLAHDPLFVHTFNTEAFSGKWDWIAPDRPPGGGPSPIGPAACVAAVTRDERSLDIFFVDASGAVRHKLRRNNPDLATANVQIDTERTVCIKHLSSLFNVSAENGGGAGVRADRVEVHEWETFTLQQFATQTIDGGRVLPVFALRAHNGQYLSAEHQGGGGMHLTADRWAVADWEKFRFEQIGAEPWSGGIQTQTGWYWCAEDGGGSGVAPNRSSIGPWETFRVLPV